MKSNKNLRGAPIDSTADLARRLHLSRWTISRVLNGHAGVSPETVRRVKEAMAEFGFAPNPLASGLRKGTTNIIGVCIPEMERLYLSQKLEFLRQSLVREGCHVMLGVTNGDVQEEAETLNRFRTLHAAGVILFASRLESHGASIRAFDQSGVPLVSVDPFVAPTEGCVCVDRAAGMREAVAHLFNLGHRRVLALGFGEGDRYRASRLAGVAAEYKAAGRDFERDVCRLSLAWEVKSSYRQGLEAAPAVWRTACKGEGCTAVLALNDRVAIGLIDGLRTLNVRVPGELSVIGYDNMEVGQYFLPRLTSIDAQPDALVKAATERLLALIRKEQNEEPPQPVVSRLVVRDSTGPARE